MSGLYPRDELPYGNVAAPAAITGSEKQARQGERGFVRRERNYAHHSTRQKDFAKRFLAKRRRRLNSHGNRASRGCLQNAACADDVTKAKRKFNTVLRSLYEAVRSLYVVFYTTSHLILSLVNTQISLAILSALVAISSAE